MLRRVAAEDAGKKAQDHGMKTLDVEVKGPGAGRESALRALQAIGFHDFLNPRRDALSRTTGVVLQSAAASNSEL